MGQCQPVSLGTRTEIAQRVDDFLAGALGSEDTLDEDVIEVGLAFGSPRGFADIHICRHYQALSSEIESIGMRQYFGFSDRNLR